MLMFLFALLVHGRFHFMGAPDFLLLFIVALAVKENNIKTISYSFVAGFLEDVLFSVGFVNALAKTLLGMLALYMKQFFVIDKKLLALILAFILTPISFLISYFSILYFQSVQQLSFPWINMVVSSIINAVLCPSFYLILNRFSADEE
ncbi:rod shape-determining protein MreD [candidate division WOR-1 bacterium RIFOXYC2_FULL_37_10]|uniref:Rod shape-determining protein MreD n=1 Tax=candidate division WOR-1 bacterium RIFOXYB2_FULL_37_13 TaxID=1802579 RepID=A0A1F4SQ22_UNCSA|nr:MAG: rod shape-determining protein MreD [candidate division WOR-1 bacterium RIFOXYA2_FULL_37_7]OGC22534.1 MAG: rod shape-determining protein MreD [candidate division WOR-1 bacterium RIFOXYB2_FULL_37_13]OGC34915.1 MAG: rod shape-determining protein MreD [candidate division WOR-1 bacterium RIFOXYC2_FULL_37_10]